jgi:hypothetical protein
MDDAVVRVVVSKWRDALIGMEAHMQLLAVIFALTSEETTDEAVQAWQSSYADPFEQITAALALAVHALAVHAPAVDAPRGRRARAEQEMVALSHRLLRHYRGLLPMMVSRMSPPPSMPMAPQPLLRGRHPPQSPQGRRAAATLSEARIAVDDAADRLRKRDLLTLTTLVFHRAFWSLMRAAAKLVQRAAALRDTERTWKEEEQAFYNMLIATQDFLRAAHNPNHLRALESMYGWGVRRGAERAGWVRFLPKAVPQCFSRLTDEQVACVAHAIAAFASNNASDGFRSLLDAARMLSPDALSVAQGDLSADMRVRVQDWTADLRAFFGSVVEVVVD